MNFNELPNGMVEGFVLLKNAKKKDKIRLNLS